jgi:hypothetical protein
MASQGGQFILDRRKTYLPTQMPTSIEIPEEVVDAGTSISMTGKQRNDTDSFSKMEMEITHHQPLRDKKKRGC